MRNLDKDGNIAEPSSDRYGQAPDPDVKREKLLLKTRWFWLLIPMVGIVIFAEMSDELTKRWGHKPWWL